MKRIFFWSLIFWCISSCNKVAQLANINVDIPYSQQFSAPAVPYDTTGYSLPLGGVSLPFPAVPLATNSQQYVTQYHTAIDKITNVSLVSFNLTMNAPAGANFNFIDSVQLYISAPSQPEVIAGYAYNIPKGATSLTLMTDSALNLENYFVQDTLYFRLSTHINAIPASGTQMEMNAVFNLQANPLN